MLTILLLAWIIPHQRAALTFTEAEVAFLFPAPISRRGLIHFKLLRSQVAILFTTLLLTLVTNRFGGLVWIHAAGWWLILSILSLHMLGSSFALTMLMDRGISNWQRRLGILALVLALAGTVIVWGRQTMPAFDLSRFEDLQAVQDYAQQVLTAGPLPYLLYPVRLVVRPCLAPNALAFLYALGPALLLLLLHYAWVVRSNVAFEEASVEASRKLAEKVAAVRAGNWQAAQQQVKRRRPPFKLRPSGPPAVALLWKNLISAGQAFTLRVWLSLAVFAVFASVGFGQASRQLRHSAGAGDDRGGADVLVAAAWAAVSAPGFPPGPAAGGPPQDLSTARLAACAWRTAGAGGGPDRRSVVSADSRGRAVRATGGQPRGLVVLAGNGFRCGARHSHAQLDHAADSERGHVAVPGVVPGDQRRSAKASR